MNKINKKELILWIKRLVGFFAMGFWFFIIYKISQMPVPFIEQAPYCIGSTMLVFGLLSALYKSLDYWLMKENA